MSAKAGRSRKSSNDPPYDLVIAYYEEQLAKYSDKMTPEDRAKTEALLAKLKDAAAKKDPEAFKASTQELHTALETATGETIAPPPGFVAAGTDANGHTILAQKPKEESRRHRGRHRPCASCADGSRWSTATSATRPDNCSGRCSPRH